MEIPYTFLLLMVSVPTLAFNDEFMSCDIYLESKRAARVLDHIPCDMGKQSFCAHKGAAYPEAAIWRFKEENRALMKRLYGDMDSTTVYREMRGFSMNIITDHGMFPNHEYNIRVGSGLATVQSAREQIEPSERSQPKMKRKVIKRKKVSTTSTTAQSPSPSEKVKVITSTTSSSSSVRVSTSEAPPTATPTATPTTVEGPAIYPMTATEAAITYTTNAVTADETTLLDETRVPETIVPSEPEVTTQIPSKEIAQHQEVSPNPYTAQDYTVQDFTNPDFTVQDFTSEFLADVDVQELEHIVGQILPDNQQKNPEPTTQQQENDQHYHQYHEENYPEHEYEDVEYEGVYDDHHYEQKIEYTGESVNACPVKEEVFAPYWANNTRDQVLALLNLYPFEQYIHMETCKYENEEMMCRPGCRCEQQYRLHRLLAFDPNNECRGIFSDWFRFPSYCICKCYNMKEDLFIRHPRKEVDQSMVEPKIEPQVEEKEVGNSLEEEEQSHRETKEAKFHPPMIQNIPAFLPYEAKQALLHAMNNPSSTRQSKTVDAKENKEAKKEKEQEKEAGSARENRGDDSFDQHFFYGNEPILHYKLADNSEGTVRKTPRR